MKADPPWSVHLWLQHLQLCHQAVMWEHDWCGWTVQGLKYVCYWPQVAPSARSVFQTVFCVDLCRPPSLVPTVPAILTAQASFHLPQSVIAGIRYSISRVSSLWYSSWSHFGEQVFFLCQLQQQEFISTHDEFLWGLQKVLGEQTCTAAGIPMWRELQHILLSLGGRLTPSAFLFLHSLWNISQIWAGNLRALCSASTESVALLHTIHATPHCFDQSNYAGKTILQVLNLIINASVNWISDYMQGGFNGCHVFLSLYNWQHDSLLDLKQWFPNVRL